MKELDELGGLIARASDANRYEGNATYRFYEALVTKVEALAAGQEGLAKRVAALEGLIDSVAQVKEAAMFHREREEKRNTAPAEPSEEDANWVAERLCDTETMSYHGQGRSVLSGLISRGWTPPRTK